MCFNKRETSKTDFKWILTKAGISQHLSLLAHEVVQAMSNICNWNCLKISTILSIISKFSEKRSQHRGKGQLQMTN